MKYLVKKIVSGEVVSYQVKQSTDAKHRPRGGGYLFLETDLDLISPIVATDAKGGLILIEDPTKDLERQVTGKYQEMVADVYAQMLIVFGTKNDVSASAFAATWEAMKKRPTNYVDVDLGLVDEAAVTAFAGSKLSASDAYGVFRLKRIAQYQSEKSAILGV